jgi:hypothetical protein
VENHEPCEECHAVRRQVGGIHEQHSRRMRQAHPQGFLVRVLGGQGQHHCGTDRHRPERQGLLDQIWPALPLPGPAAQDVADRRAGEPRRDRRQASSSVPGSKQEGQRDLARHEGGERHGHEPAEALAQRAAKATTQGRGKPGRYECHGSPRYLEDRRVIQSGIQYGNRTMLEEGNLRIATRPRWHGRRRQETPAIADGEPPPSRLGRGRQAAAGRGQSKRDTDKAGARS